MDWAEELKMSIRKTTARKGRRSKSRDLLNEQKSSTPTFTGSEANKEISIDITLDMQQYSSSSATPQTSSKDSELKRPPVRRISGGWADSSGLKGLKSKKGSFDDERFQFSTPKSTKSTTPDDDIPIIPDLEDIKDEIILNEIVEPPIYPTDRVATLKELNYDLLSQNAFSSLADMNLTVLLHSLAPQNSLDEADEVWEWEKVFTQITAEIRNEKTNAIPMQKLEIGPDEMPPMMHA
ncbi:intraflagellar transport protein 43 homolog [Teleopsis dalmanni]|uniref:intraflagellar transport protein 43 homolog n=1 Tax=Teleopsis dalmanni TaxID=139649 RepID=UPI0018CE6A49|nr:intraflagellar transport protein 43 homolog [Teleopsis dalmanni]XP_037957219.1 intraflagellar transport protein 43 homolog [Teleopsis dalmanni]